MKNKLIELYCTICQCNDSRFREKMQRLSNNKCPQFSDEELITVYLWGVGQHLSTRKAVYQYTKSHLSEWFPKLPSYQAFCRRLNWLAGAFQALAEIFGEKMLEKSPDTHAYVVDSMPIMLAHRSNSTRAKVGRPLCNKCFNSTRKEWYHGVKLHVLAMLRPGKLPIPIVSQISQASLCDLWAAQRIDWDCTPISHGCLLADRAYTDSAWAKFLKKARNVDILVPHKRPVNDPLRSGNCLNTGISRRRQPIEAFFHWIDVKSAIQNASHIRSLNGLFFHIFAALAFIAISLFFYY